MRRTPLALAAIVLVVATACVSSDTADGPSHPSGLTWPPPDLHQAETILVGRQGGTFNLRADCDYLVQLTEPVAAIGGVSLIGGRNVVLIGGSITIPPAGPLATMPDRRALYVAQQTGTVHVEGLLISDDGGDLSEGIQINSPDATVQLQNVRVEGVHARDTVTFSDNHPDLVQPWGGVRRLAVDRFSGVTTFQGFYLTPSRGAVKEVDLRRVDIQGTATSGYLLWADRVGTLKTDDVWLKPAPGRAFPATVRVNRGAVRSRGIHEGRPPSGPFVPREEVGPGYTSPGYQPAAAPPPGGANPAAPAPSCGGS